LPVKDIVTRIKKIQPSCLVVVDAAQAVPHMSVDVSDWGADAVAFSGHKMCGPTGIGILWAKQDLLESLAPFLYGGDMIKEVHTDRTVFNDIPHKFEAGTPHIAGAMGLRAAVKYLEKIGMDAIREHEEEIMSYALIKLSELSDLTIYGPHDAKRRSGVIAFRMKGIHPHDIAQVLDQDNICIRVGFHCAQPLHEHLEIGPTARASFYMYTTKNDIDLFVQGLEKVRKIFR
ncbi:MAG: aminotransferase class V-fold PLP-dependent enzyme, partial [bacterium]|nr:aminotransferase class V-fold PLP-dependent enzyme [bacterium]